MLVGLQESLDVCHQVVNVEWFVDQVNALRVEVAFLLAHKIKRGSAYDDKRLSRNDNILVEFLQKSLSCSCMQPFYFYALAHSFYYLTK